MSYVSFHTLGSYKTLPSAPCEVLRYLARGPGWRIPLSEGSESVGCLAYLLPQEEEKAELPVLPLACPPRTRES